MDTTLIFVVNEFLDFSKKSVKGVQLDGSVNYNSTSITLRWESLAGAEAYEVYAKRSSLFESNYSVVGEQMAVVNGKTDTLITLPTTGWFAEGDSVLLLVAARNGKGKSGFGEPFMVKDHVKPKFSKASQIVSGKDTANFAYNATSYFNTLLTETTLTAIVTFNEPMDTTSTLPVSLPGESPREIIVTKQWTNETALTVTIKIGAGALNTRVTALSLPIVITGLRDNAKNGIDESNYNKAKYWNDLRIHLYVDAVAP